jgi:hypothetical protein
MADNITLGDGGTVSFWVVPFDNGEKGTYLLDINVSRRQILPDIYEVNNTFENAYELPLVFSEDAASVRTTGSNLHTLTDEDHYKIELPADYEYTVTARLHDAKNSGDGNSYSVDVLFSYSIGNEALWSDPYDDVMAGNITLSDGGTVNFWVLPYSLIGAKGTYLLEINVNRRGKIGIENRESSDDVVIYPNPAQENITISGLLNSENITLTDISGRTLYTAKSNGATEMQIPVSSLASGMYFVRISGNTSVKTVKVVKE